jgi:hypothetical protein
MTFQMCQFHGELLPKLLKNFLSLYLQFEGEEFEKAIFLRYLEILHFDLLEEFDCFNFDEWFKLDPMHLGVARCLFLNHFSEEFVQTLEELGMLDDYNDYTNLEQLELELDRLVKKYLFDAEMAKRNFRRQTKSKKLPFE